MRRRHLLQADRTKQAEGRAEQGDAAEPAMEQLQRVFGTFGMGQLLSGSCLPRASRSTEGRRAHGGHDPSEIPPPCTRGTCSSTHGGLAPLLVVGKVKGIEAEVPTMLLKDYTISTCRFVNTDSIQIRAAELISHEPTMRRPSLRCQHQSSPMVTTTTAAAILRKKTLSARAWL
ncbi:unnamed protein product [Urochloa humidicola]